MKPLKLTVEPIPATSAGKSLNRLLPKSRWDKIRKKVYAEYDHRCAVCGIDPKHPPTKVFPRYAPKLTDPVLVQAHKERIEKVRNELPPRRRPRKVRLECHEEWEYDEATGVQRLSGLVALCTRCHQVKHWNWARTLLMPQSWWPEEVKSRYRGPRLRKGGPWSSWSDEQKFAAQTLSAQTFYPDEYFLEDHFMWVNDCDLKTLREHVEEAAEVCFRRSHYQWRVDFGKLA
ncbi:MAG: hypothetical protein WKF67_08375 [Rubrobacteraceae bacterium]